MSELTPTGRTVDEERFAALFFAHSGRLVRLAALLGTDDPEDVVQETFCKVYAARARLRESDAEAAGYLTRTLVNEVRSRQRRSTVARRKHHLLALDDAVGSPDVGARDAVLTAVRALPPRQREAVVLRYWLDLPLAEIAEAMGVRLGTAKSQLSRGLAAVEASLHRSDTIEEGVR
jgi:RNA polymerase sigma factor (sigma-70 family)